MLSGSPLPPARRTTLASDTTGSVQPGCGSRRSTSLFCTTSAFSATAPGSRERRAKPQMTWLIPTKEAEQKSCGHRTGGVLVRVYALAMSHGRPSPPTRFTELDYP
jgi:hypothetical protein